MQLVPATHNAINQLIELDQTIGLYHYALYIERESKKNIYLLCQVVFYNSNYDYIYM